MGCPYLKDAIRDFSVNGLCYYPYECERTGAKISAKHYRWCCQEDFEKCKAYEKPRENEEWEKTYSTWELLLLFMIVLISLIFSLWLDFKDSKNKN